MEFHHSLARFSHSCPDVVFLICSLAELHTNWALRLAPQNHVYHHDLAVLYASSGEQDKAVVEMRRTAELCGTEADRMMFHAAACKIAGDMRGAIEWEKKAVAPSPDEALHHDHLTEFFLELGRTTRMRSPRRPRQWPWRARSGATPQRTWRFTAISGVRERVRSSENVSRSAGRLRRGQWNSGPALPSSALHRAATHFKLGNRSQALADLAKAIELKPDDLNALTWIPLQHVADCPDQQFCNGFLDPVDDAVRLNNQSAEARIARATILAEMGQRDLASAPA